MPTKTHTDNLARLARLARTEQTRAIYQARLSLARAYTFRADLARFGNTLFGRYIPSSQRFMSQQTWEDCK